ncbi:peptidase family C78-domain-containing protein [Chaetomium tenue]|uniref:Peptidase family C78-domain-containing protein n=1 Tax=Chaetomium tenue TaxID=1854479 RepID=A0ACB7PIS0_9PEZI|nr:peptidase family C78-domain-containing protein [Chaetomium globosum]
MAEDKAMVCPFCGWENGANGTGEYEILLHMETFHPEGEGDLNSHFGVKEDDNSSTRPSTAEDVSYVECPIDGCGEILLLQELDYHLELHSEESGHHLQEEGASVPVPHAKTEAPPPSGPSRAHREAERHRRSDREPEKSDRQATAVSAWKRLLRMPGSSTAHKILSSRRSQNEDASSGHSNRGKRLGKAQLGKYAHEDRMPDWLVAMLKKNGQVTSQGVISVLALLLGQSPSTKYAYLCHPSVQHVSKLKREGAFCGYRNIQMLSSCIVDARLKGHEHFHGAIPSIFQIQEWVETAWDQGINPQGRLETGGIRGTRKYIGTPEALAVFRLLDIPCDAEGVKHKEPGKSEALLMEYVENYFQSGVEDPEQQIRQTNLPPLYFQHAGHSLTIVGFEKLKNGSKQLIVFDPSFHDSSYIVRLVGKTFTHPMPDLALKPYRRGSRYLKAYKEFELLKSVPLPPAMFIWPTLNVY